MRNCFSKRKAYSLLVLPVPCFAMVHFLGCTAWLIFIARMSDAAKSKV